MCNNLEAAPNCTDSLANYYHCAVAVDESFGANTTNVKLEKLSYTLQLQMSRQAYNNHTLLCG